jgi:guanosine-3',5'-bis(diphosphate) 3'-pyrophosphohydrolase
MSDSVQQSLLNALLFAAKKHARQRRKDVEATPYINHPIAVAELLARVGGVAESDILKAAVLHDTIEDTQTTPEELERLFGTRVRLLVQELTDDKSLPKQERKRLQIEHAPKKSAGAKQIKIADKTCNIGDITPSQPADWPLQRKKEYLDWAERVVAGCRGCNPELERHFDAVLAEQRKALENSAAS